MYTPECASALSSRQLCLTRCCRHLSLYVYTRVFTLHFLSLSFSYVLLAVTASSVSDRGGRRTSTESAGASASRAQFETPQAEVRFFGRFAPRLSAVLLLLPRLSAMFTFCVCIYSQRLMVTTVRWGLSGCFVACFLRCRRLDAGWGWRGCS